MTKMSSALPKDETLNGLSGAAQPFLADPDTLRPAIVFLKTSKTIMDTETGTSEPLLRVERIELVSDRFADALQSILLGSLSDRLGTEQLPLWLHEEIVSALSSTAPPAPGDDDSAVKDAS